MSASPSIRSFALDYYRKRGAEIRPVDGGDEAFEICPTTGASLVVTFADDRDTKAAPVNQTSPQWRAILEDLTADVAVSYRYLAAGAIARPAQTLAAALGEGWAVETARLLNVENRVALGFTHRVTFDSPALNACTEALYNHLWDVDDERRLTSLEAKLYDLPCIMIRPERFPPETTVQGLLGRTLAMVDESLEARGRDIERELATMLDEAEKRTNQYFEQQLGNVLQREVTLGEKLEAAIKRMTEARTPEAGTRARQDADGLARQLEHARAHRELELGVVEAACTTKLATERDRHELTATTDLVALCHASYDVLTYRCAVTTPDGHTATWDLRYWPLSGEVMFPACPRCELPMTAPTYAGDAFACATCLPTCTSCATAHPDATGLGTCDHCQRGTCTGCVASCVDCHASTCTEHVLGCATCEAPVCTPCAARCATCESPLCQRHAHLEAGLVCCDRHIPVAVAAPIAAPEAVPAAPVAAPAAALPAPAAAPAAQEPKPLRVPDWLLDGFNDSEAAAPLFTPSHLSTTRPVAPVDTCPCCTGSFPVQQMVDCPTCGVPSCKACVAGPAGPCPACEGLGPVDTSHPRLAFVFAQLPKLARGRKWELAQLGPYVLAHWQRLGTWGMVVYHTGGAEPVIVTNFEVGRFDAFKQALGGLVGGDK